jgi:N-acetylglucosamine malate deacetylase 2
MVDVQRPYGNVLILVAHPDDETVAFGGLLQQIHRATVVFATDGAPLHHFLWKPYSSREAYAEIRRRECNAALRFTRSEAVFIGDLLNSCIADRELCRHVSRAAGVLQEIIRKIKPDCILTLAYEGGHPDHDTCCFLAFCAGRRAQIPVWESPLYHRRPDGSIATQVFARPNGQEEVLQLSGEFLVRKAKMLEAYESQKKILAGFRPEAETFRPMARYDFRRPPLPCRLNYEAWGFPISGETLSHTFACHLNSETNHGLMGEL